MGILDIFKQNKKVDAVQADEPNPRKSRAESILEKESQSFFPKDGHWYSTCFERPQELDIEYLPCHLRDTVWMSQLFQKQLWAKGRLFSQKTIKDFMDTSDVFANLRHNYELEIVKWQINWIKKGGENWMMPKGFDDTAMISSSDVDQFIRSGVAKTLTAIGINFEVIEEGLEKYADMWRYDSMRRGFRNQFEPLFMSNRLAPADNKHRDNWIAAREYDYYQRHQNAVDRYGEPTDAMLMSQAEHGELLRVLAKQNAARKEYLQQCTFYPQSPVKKSTLDIKPQGLKSYLHDLDKTAADAEL